MADCKIEKNKVGKIVAVKDQSGNKSTLFQELLNVPTLSLNEAIDAYKNIYSEQLKDKVQFQKAYHGGKTNISKFLTDFIGTGNKSMFGGWGLYFTLNEARAKSYAEQLAKQKIKIGEYEIIKNKYSKKFETIKEIIDTKKSRLSIVKELLSKVNELKEKYSEQRDSFFNGNFNDFYAKYAKAEQTPNNEESKKIISEYEKIERRSDLTLSGIKDEIRELRDLAKKIIKSGAEFEKENSYLYEVSFPDSLNLLDFDKKIEEEQYNALLNQAIKENSPFIEAIKSNANKKGRDFYFNVAQYSTNTTEKELSLLMLRAGIDGNTMQSDGFNTDIILFNEDSITIENQIQFQVIGERGAKNLDQIEEATFRMDNLKVAREMEAAGKTPKEIRLATGWEKNLADQKWRYEILDGSVKDVSLNYTNNNELFENPTANIKLSELYFNQELFKAYPQLKNIEVIFYDTKNELYNTNFLFVLNDKIYINKEYYEGFKLANRPTNLYNAPTPSKAIAHELSHIIQNIEGFAVGSSRKFNEDKIRESIKFFRNNPQGDKLRSGYNAEYDKYLRRILESKLSREIVDNIYSPNGLDIEAVVKNIAQIAYENFAGEVEARNVEKRFFMSPQERLEQTLQETQDIPFEDQFVLQFKNNIQSSQRTAPQITQEIIDRLKQNGLSEDVFLLSTEEINAKLIELGVEADVRRQIIGEIGAKNLKNATRVLKNLEVAKKMKIEGKDELTIKIATGWEYNKGDKKWRMEVDSKSIYKNVSIPKSFNIFKPNEKQPLERFFKKKELFKLYPQLKEYQVMVKINTRGDFLGAVSPERKLIIVPFSSLYFKSTLIHEIQHAIQEEEGFAVGGSPGMFTGLAENKQKEYEMLSQEIKDIFRDKNDSWKEKVKPFMTEYLEVGSVEYTNNIENLTDFDRLLDLLVQYREVVYSKDRKYFLTPEQQYNNLAGEVEARNAQSRIDMSIEQKRNSLLSLTEDVVEEDKIYIQNAITIEEQIQFQNKQVIGEKGANKVEEYNNLLNQAKELEKQGKDYSQTGWFKTENNEWKYFSNEYVNQFKFKENLKINQEQNFEDVIEDNVIFQLYPESKKLKIVLYDAKYTNTNLGQRLRGTNGAYSKDQNTIFINVDNADGKGMEHIIGHELNHFVQGMEGFSTGGDGLSTLFYALESTNYDRKGAVGVREYLVNYDRASLSKNDATIFDNAIKVYDAFKKNDKNTLSHYYDRIEGEIDSRAVELAITLKNKYGKSELTYKQLKDATLKKDGIDINEVISLYYKGFEYNVGINLITNGLTYKDSKTGKDIVILNKDTADDSTSIHEFSHIFSKWQKENRPELWKKGQNLAKNAIKNGEIKDIENYVKQTQPKLKEGTEAFYDEVLQEYISRESRNMMDEQKQKSPLMQWLSDFWASIADLMGLTSMTPEQVANLSLKDFARATVADLLSGERIKEQNLIEQAIQRNNGNPLTLAPNGKPSILYQSYKDLGYSDIEVEKLIAQVYSDSFLDFFGDWINDPQNASKVVDENGMPLVVYHGSPYAGINIFDREQNKRRQKSGIKEFGTYFTTNIRLAEAYRNWNELAEKDVKEIDLEIEKLKNQLYEVRNNKYYEIINSKIEELQSFKSGKVYPIFLNLKTIKEFNAKGKENLEAWDELEVTASYKRAKNRNAMEFLKDGSFGVEKVDGIKANNIVDAFVQGDEVLSKELLGDVFLVFDGQSQNIKSATENIGTFSTDSNDIRYQIIGEKGANRIQQYKDSLDKAKELEKQGKTLLEIEQQTGWYKYKGLWKTLPKEVLESFSIKNNTKDKILKLKEVLDEGNKIFEFYPELNSTKVVFVGKGVQGMEMPENFENGNGTYNEASGTILINTVSKGIAVGDREQKYTLAHEIQHAIQKLEQHPRGGHIESILDEAMGILSIKSERLSDIFNEIKNADKSKLTENEKLIVEASLQTITAIEKGDTSVLKNQYKHLLGEIDANVVEGALKIKDNQNIIAKSYSELLNVYAQLKKIDLNKVFLLKNGNIRFSVIGEKGASRIQEYNNLLNEAKQLEKQGKDYSQTGWYKGVDGWKYLSKEAIEDFKIVNKEENKVLKLKEVLGNENVLFKIYPEIKDLSVVFLNKNAKGYEKFEPIKEDTAGEFQAENEIIRLNTYYQGNRASIQELSFVLGHEVAHRLQRIENFSRGGNSTTILNEALSILNIENTGNLGEIYSKISKADKSNLTKNQLKIVKDSSKTIEAILNRNVSTLVKQYNRLMGEIDANIVGDLVTKGTATGTYADLLALYLDGNNIDPESIYYISGGNIQFSLKNQPQTQVIEPKPNFNGYSTYKEAVDNTPLNEKIEIRIDDVVLAEVTSDGAINDLVRQGIIEDRRELEPNGNITYKTSGGNLTMKLINAHIAKEVLGGKINKSGDIRTEQKKEIKFSDNFEDNKKEFGEDVALSLLVSDALADNTPAFGVGRIITEKVDIPSETDLMIKLKNLLNELGIKSMNLDAWEKRFGKKANSNALADIANRIVAFAEGQFNQDTLSEETGHFIIEAMPIEKIQPLLDIVHKTDEWREYSANYMQIYNGNEKLVRKEILGKVLKNALQEKAKQQTTLQGQSVVDRIGNFFVEFIENIKKLFTSNHKERLNKFTDEVYDKLMAEELFDELKPEQFEGNKLVMYQAQVNDTLAQSIQKMLKQLGILDRKLNSSQKESIQKINDEIDLLDEVSQLDAVVGIASVLKKHIDYLNNRGKKQGFLSTEESFVYNTTQDLGKALESILPKLDVLQSRKYREKAIISAKEALDSLSTLTANLNQEKEDRFETIVADLIEKNGLSEQQKDILLKEIKTQSRDTNVLEAWFGGVIHAQNPILNVLAKRLSRMNKEVNINSSQGFNKFFTDMKNVAGYKSEEVASLMKKWARGNYIFSPYDFEKEERESNLLRLGVIKSIAPDVYKKYETKFKTQEKILEDFSKNADIWLSDLTQEQNSDYRFLANEAIKNAGHRIDALSKKEREKFDSIIGSLNLSLKTKKIIQEFKDKKSKVFRESKLNNGFSEEDLQQLQEIQADYQKIASPYDFDGNIKDGLSVDKDNIVKAIVPKDSLDEEVRISLELNEYREALKTLYSDTNKNAFDGFFKQLEEVRNSTKDKAQLQKNIDNFIRLNTRIFFTEEFWSNSDKNESVVDRLLDMDDSDATRVAEDIQKFNTKLKNLLKRNKLYNRPSQIDYENLSAADESEIKDLVESLETKFREAKNILPKKEYEYIERNFISVTNDAYKIELANNGIVSANEKISDKDLKEKIDFITKHVTYSGKQAISRMIDKIAVFNTSSKKIPKGLNLTKEEILEDKNKAILDYAESKLMPYFKTLQSNKKGSENAEINLINEMGNAKSAQEMEAIYKKYKEDFYIDASPSFIFEDADTSDRLNKEFKKRLEENEPLLSDKFLNKDFFNYFGIDMKKGFSVNTAIATKNQKEFEAWKLTIAFQEESLDLYKVKGKNNKYLLPQYRRGTFARVSQIASGLSVDKIKEAFNDAFTYREDNPELGQAGDGEILQLYQKNSLIIPKTGLKRLESTETTDELLYSYMLMRKEAVKYDRRVDTWADVEAMEHYIKGKTYGDKTGEATRTYQKFNDFKRYNIYGQSETFSWETDMFGMLSKKKNLAPAISRAQNYVRNNNLAYNILTPITSFLQGTTNFFVENVVGDRIDRSAARLAAKELPSLMTKASSEFFDVTKKSKANLLLQFMGQDNPSEAFENSNYSKFLRGASIYKSGYLTHYLADLPIQLQTLLTVLHDYRIVNGDIVDYYTWRRRNRRLKEAEAKAEWKKYQDNVIYKHIIPNKGGSLEVSSTVKSIDGWENKIQQMRDRLTVAKQDIDNQISEGDKGMVQRHALLSWTTLHKGWLVSSMTKRFKGQHLNLHNNMMEEGTYRGTGKFIVSLIRDVKRVGLKNSWKQNFKTFDGGYKLDKNAIYDEKGQVFKTFANEKDAKDYYEDLIFDFTKMRQISVIRAGVEFLVTSVLAALAITASKMADDDDDDYIKEFTAYLTYRLASEVTSQSFGIPAQGYAFLENPTVGMTQLQNALDVLDLFEDKEISRGTYKGYTKRQAWFIKMIPGLKEYNKIINIERTRQSYEFYNEKNLKFTVTGQMMLED